jgi:hypothetical protein
VSSYRVSFLDPPSSHFDVCSNLISFLSSLSTHLVSCQDIHPSCLEDTVRITLLRRKRPWASNTDDFNRFRVRGLGPLGV